MKRVIMALVVAIEAVGVLAAGLGVSFIPLILLWMTEYQLGFPFSNVIGFAAATWLLAHRVPLTVELSDVAVQSLGTGSEPLSFVISLAPLGITLITVWAGVTLGRRASASIQPLAGIVGGVIGFALGAWLIGAVLIGDVVGVTGHYVLAPTTIYLISILTGFFYWSVRNNTPLYTRFLGWYEESVTRAVGAHVRSVLSGIRLGLTAGVGVVGVAAAIFACVIVVKYASIMALGQSLQPGWAGALTLTVAEAALLPNAVIWTAAWLLGPGFALGIGSSVSPVATNVGPLPAFPLFGAIPEGTHSWGLLGVLVPVVIAFVLSYRVFANLRDYWGGQVPLLTPVLSACGAAGGGALILGGLAAVSGGAIGPQRLQEVGPMGWEVALWAAIYIGAASLLGYLVSGISARALRWGPFQNDDRM
ncbi:DUF6350 family protein [Lysinibacter sp. HNR]|uniref:cell division protein PerM n=1 Tax=Lysinibacter sp. HNR TaxID=3031408 RepID=UPI002435A0A4|nr:DUF6350 family protein [Lysinibacter sp. HNR]WGD38007.1 DUF6350 family protein [Lysinibacter sp. HNR]